MSTDHGFTMIEMLLVLTLVSAMSLLAVYSKPYVSTQNELLAITYCFDIARLHAITHKETVKVKVTKHYIDVSSTHQHISYQLNRHFAFTTPHTFTYNNNGHIKIAKTIRLDTPDGEKAFVFQLGSGTYYVK